MHLGFKKLHLNWIGNSILANNFLNYPENNRFSESVRDDTVSEDESNVYNDCAPDPKQMLKNICNRNVNKLTFGHVIINSLRNKFDQLTEMVKGIVDIFLISESKLSLKFNSLLMATIHPTGLIGKEMEGNVCYMSVRTYQKMFYTAIFLLLNVFILRLFFIRKDG